MIEAAFAEEDGDIGEDEKKQKKTGNADLMNEAGVPLSAHMLTGGPPGYMGGMSDFYSAPGSMRSGYS